MQAKEKAGHEHMHHHRPVKRKDLSQSVRAVVLYSLQSVTPARLGLLLFVNFILIAMFCFTAISTINQHEHTVRTVGIDAAPSVVAAYEIKTAVSAMDGDLAAQLLYEPDDRDAHDMQLDFDKWRIVICRQLVAASSNITYGKEELVPIENIQIALGKFEQQAQAARDIRANGRYAEAVLAYRAAMNTVDTELIPNANKLEKADSDILESTYAQEKSATNLSRGAVLLMGMVLIGVLLYTQGYLTTRFRRRICPPVALALVCVTFAANHLTASLGGNSQAMKALKEDSYDSVLAMQQTRAKAYEAVACAARRLIDRDHADTHQRAFDAAVRAVAAFEGDHGFDETIARAEKQVQLNDRVRLPGFKGALAVELNNLCFPGEADAALDTLQHFASYWQADSEVQDLEKNGAHDEAVHKCLSFAPGGAKYPFVKFDDALLQTLKINREVMDNKVKEAFDDLQGLVIETEAVCLLAVVCVYLGLLPRMEEYFHCDPSAMHE